MTSWAISWERRAVKDVKKLDRTHRERIIEAIEELAEDPLGRGRALTGAWKGLRRYRAGSYRIIYVADQGQLRILIARVGHRRDVYR